MPPVVAAVASIFSTIAAGVAVFFGSVGGIGAFLGKLAINFSISALVGKLLKPKSSGYASSTRENQVVVRSAIAARNIIYGRAVTSGPLVFAHSTGTSKEYLHLVIAIAGHEIDSIEKIYFNDEEVGTLDGSGNVTTGRFANYARIKKYLGTTTQTADADLVSEAAGYWTSNHRLQGVAYLYVRLKHSYDVYAGGLPNIKALVKGKKVYDPRDTVTRWTDNSALCARDYLISNLGLGASTAEIDDTYVSAAANVCDERVSVTNTGVTCTFDATANTITIDAAELRFDNGDGVRFTTSGTLPSPLAAGTTYYLVRSSPTTCKVATTAANARDGVTIDLTTSGSGTHTLVHYDQSRYTTNGIITSDRIPRENIQAILTSMAGSVVWVQGEYRIHAGAYTSPAFSLDEDDLRSSVSVQTRTPRKDLFNAVRGIYIEPWKSWQPTDFTPVENSTYETQDGSVQIFRDIDLPMVANQIRAQRIAKIHLEKSRQGITVQFPAKIRALELSAWDTVSLTVSHLGWSSKVFRVLSWQLTPEGGIDLSLQEESSTSYSWSSGDATVIDAAPDTVLPSSYTVAPPTSLTVFSGATYQLEQIDGVTLTRLYATWTAAADAFVTNYELQWKVTTDTDYQSSVLSSGATTAYISPVVSGTSYHVRIRAINGMGAASTWEGPDTIAASSDASTVSASVDYADVTGTKPPADADKTETAIESGTTVTTGSLTFDAGGHIKGGQTAYNTGTGWFLGYSGGAYKFSVGDPSGDYFAWDGANLYVRGDTAQFYVAGTDTALKSADLGSQITVSNGTAKAASKVKEIQIDGYGTVTCRVYSQVVMGGTGLGATANLTAHIYINGVLEHSFSAIGSFGSVSPPQTYEADVTHDISVTVGDKVQVYLSASNHQSVTSGTPTFNYYCHNLDLSISGARRLVTLTDGVTV